MTQCRSLSVALLLNNQRFLLKTESPELSSIGDEYESLRLEKKDTVKVSALIAIYLQNLCHVTVLYNNNTFELIWCLNLPSIIFIMNNFVVLT